MVSKNELIEEFERLTYCLNSIENVIFESYNIYSTFETYYDWFNKENCKTLKRFRKLLKTNHVQLHFEINDNVIEKINNLTKEMPFLKLNLNTLVLTYYRENGVFNLPLELFFQFKDKIINSYNIRNLLYEMPKKEKKAAKIKIFEMKKNIVPEKIEKPFDEKIESSNIPKDSIFYTNYLIMKKMTNEYSRNSL